MIDFRVRPTLVKEATPDLIAMISIKEMPAGGQALNCRYLSETAIESVSFLLTTFRPVDKNIGMTPKQYLKKYKITVTDCARELQCGRTYLSRAINGLGCGKKLARAFEEFSGGEVHRLQLLYPNEFVTSSDKHICT